MNLLECTTVLQVLACTLIAMLTVSVVFILSLNKKIKIKDKLYTNIENELAVATGPKEHWNPQGILPPVNIKLLIATDKGNLLVKRESWAMSSDAQLDFVVQETGDVITGRFSWRYL